VTIAVELALGLLQMSARHTSSDFGSWDVFVAR